MPPICIMAIPLSPSNSVCWVFSDTDREREICEDKQVCACFMKVTGPHSSVNQTCRSGFPSGNTQQPLRAVCANMWGVRRQWKAFHFHKFCAPYHKSSVISIATSRLTTYLFLLLFLKPNFLQSICRIPWTWRLFPVSTETKKERQKSL